MRRQSVGDPSVACTNAGSLRAPFVGGRTYGADYWTSTEQGSMYGQQNFTINMDTAVVNRFMQGGSYQYARPIRAFGPVKPPTTTSTSSTTSTTVMSQVCNNTGKRPDGTTCQVGDIGPAGGIIIVASPTAIDATPGVSAGGRFLEAAPANWTTGSLLNSNVPLNACNDRTIGATETGVGGGAANTAKLQQCGGGASNIATWVVNFSLANGGAAFDDWFIPSRDEALPMAALRVKMGSLKTTDYVWTSSEIDEPGVARATAWIVSAYDGSAVPGQKLWYSGILRPVRAFG